MGCAYSGDNSPDKGVHLESCDIRFSELQLESINQHLNSVYLNSAGVRSDNRHEVEVIIERLIQKLISTIGKIDPRFSSSFLITSEPQFMNQVAITNKFSYIIRLDHLSCPTIYDDDTMPHSFCHVMEQDGTPQGYGKIRIQGEGMENWAEFIGNNGCIRRDKIQEKFVELLAKASSRTELIQTLSDVDESCQCGSPGKVMDAEVLHHVLRAQANQRVFYGQANGDKIKFPDPKDFKIAIVESTNCIHLKIGFLPDYPVLPETEDAEVDVTLILAIEFQGWPQTTNFPARIPLSHIDALYFQHMATTGFYMVPAVPHPTIRCDDRKLCWQFRFPVAESMMVTNYSSNSLIHKVYRVLTTILEDIRRSSTAGRVTSRYMIKTMLWYRLERTGDCCLNTLNKWNESSLSLHVLQLMDNLIAALKAQKFPSYFFPSYNLMLNSPGGGVMYYTEEDYIYDAEILSNLVARFFEISLIPSLSINAKDDSYWCRLEDALLVKWGHVLEELLPTKDAREISMRHYSLRQVDYIGILLRGILSVKSLVLNQSAAGGWYDREINKIFINNDDKANITEDIIYLLNVLAEQAKQYYATRKQTLTIDKKSVRLKSFDLSFSTLLDDVKADLKKVSFDFTNDQILVYYILKWLYRATERDGKFLEPVLKPYLIKLYIASHECNWFLEEWKTRMNKDEMNTLRKYCHLVVKGRMNISDGLLDFVNKGWEWAGAMLNIAGEVNDGLELIFTPSPQLALCHQLRISPSASGGFMTRSLGRSQPPRKSDMNALTSATFTLPRLGRNMESIDFLKAQIADSYEIPSVYCRLRDFSPFTLLVDFSRRYGSHRGFGNVVAALIMLQKFTILQEVSQLLPDTERIQMLEAIHKINKEQRRGKRRQPFGNSATKSAIQVLIMENKQRENYKYETYRPLMEFQLNDRDERHLEQPDLIASKSIRRTKDSLLGTCRIARNRQQNTSAVVYNPAFYDAPITFFNQDATNPGYQPYLHLNADRQLELVELTPSSIDYHTKKRNATLTKF
uniref:Mab-21-like HhH/H2TH-like domain-containing protein n=1 Tax=Cacopsylla melanoneura TaxID=428564 RepID=A0A8D8VYG2_9HEMI